MYTIMQYTMEYVKSGPSTSTQYSTIEKAYALNSFLQYTELSNLILVNTAVIRLSNALISPCSRNSQKMVENALKWRISKIGN